MAVSKRLRFEILRRDNHTCRYCGGTAPDVKLTVDHVVPTALGGSDEPDNLVAACSSCNAGKTSVSPDAPLVDDVKQDALRWALAMEEATRIQRARQKELKDYLLDFEQFWQDVFSNGYWIDEDSTWTVKGSDVPHGFAVRREDQAIRAFQTYEEAERFYNTQVDFPPTPQNWQRSVETWFSAGVSIADIQPFMEMVRDKQAVSRYDKWRYFCGCVWSLLRERQAAAQALLERTTP